jgi:gamma-D-glutamyl-L-lysine dipeptidyl-peptidase
MTTIDRGKDFLYILFSKSFLLLLNDAFMKLSIDKYFPVLFLLTVIGGGRVDAYQQRIDTARHNSRVNAIQVKHLLQSVQQHFAPDLSLAVFNIFFSQVKTGFILRGEVDNAGARDAVIHAIRKIVKGTVIDSIRVLPDSALGSDTLGIVISSVADVRRKSGEQEELLTQTLMGTVIKLLKKERGYYFIQTPDHYLGWLDSASVFVSNQTGIEAWNAAAKMIVTKFTGAVYARADVSSASVCEILDGCILKYLNRKNGWAAVELADGRHGFVPDTLVQDLEDWRKSRILTGDNLEKTAKSFLGIRYVWGGMSVKGMDCSGFVKTVYHFNGRELPRDARQQVLRGTPIETGKNFQNLKKGDLLFFGQKATAKQRERITHVAMYLENGLFIHSSRQVRLSSVHPSSDYYEESLLRRFVRARRILQN